MFYKIGPQKKVSFSILIILHGQTFDSRTNFKNERFVILNTANLINKTGNLRVENLVQWRWLFGSTIAFFINGQSKGAMTHSIMTLSITTLTTIG